MSEKQEGVLRKNAKWIIGVIGAALFLYFGGIVLGFQIFRIPNEGSRTLYSGANLTGFGIPSKMVEFYVCPIGGLISVHRFSGEDAQLNEGGNCKYILGSSEQDIRIGAIDGPAFGFYYRRQ